MDHRGHRLDHRGHRLDHHDRPLDHHDQACRPDLLHLCRACQLALLDHLDLVHPDQALAFCRHVLVVACLRLVLAPGWLDHLVGSLETDLWHHRQRHSCSDDAASTGVGPAKCRLDQRPWIGEQTDLAGVHPR